MIREIRTRPDTLDSYVVKEVRGYRHLGIEPGDVVLDVGANIGAFAVLALTYGAERVIAVEPEPENLALLRENVAGLPVDVVPAACVAQGVAEVELYVNGGQNKGAHSVETRRGRTAVKVKGISLEELLQTKPSVLKVDIEGGEYALPLGSLPRCVRALAVELHLKRARWRDEAAPRLIEAVERNGYNPVKPPRITRANWHTVGIWRR